MAAGLAALVAAALLLRGSGPYRAMAWPLAAVAAIQLAVGGTVLPRTDRQVAALGARLAADPAGSRDVEAARMERVMGGFRLYKALAAAGARSTARHSPRWTRGAPPPAATGNPPADFSSARGVLTGPLPTGTSERAARSSALAART